MFSPFRAFVMELEKGTRQENKLLRDCDTDGHGQESSKKVGGPKNTKGIKRKRLCPQIDADEADAKKKIECEGDGGLFVFRVVTTTYTNDTKKSFLHLSDLSA